MSGVLSNFYQNGKCSAYGKHNLHLRRFLIISTTSIGNTKHSINYKIDYNQYCQCSGVQVGKIFTHQWCAQLFSTDLFYTECH